ncbi:hypothetical protein GCM10011386_15370 [Parapedobacter defluvii]|uniref:DUF1772 domain-containing protein n=1 Tax=Parapedobacter defluvii TaxID=2045106 RepID=A0ABQ1LIK6_9SPHI|nr:hypothetical protein [Parapedobacter defluvii]GGC24342.1 hypothetical protein GCM10011386_15370 [Parapedobacter defluvii]
MFTFILNCLEFLILSGYFVIAAQGVFYHLALGRVFMKIPTAGFLELRQATDRYIRRPLKVFYVSMPLLMLTGIVLGIGYLSLTASLCMGIALLLLLLDIRLILRSSEPINQLVNQLTDLPNVEGGNNLQHAWVQTMLRRGYFNGMGFLSLIVGQVFG